MSKVNIYNLSGEVKGEIELPEIFNSTPNEQLIAQYIRVFLANQRQGTRATKDRSQVRGNAKKPYKQKGTGRARHGSLKAPSMKGGGIAHGPHPANFSLKMSKMMKKNALISALAKQKDNIKVLESGDLEKTQTKLLKEFLKVTDIQESSLFVTHEKRSNLVLSSRNLSKTAVTTVTGLNPYLLLNSKTLIIEKDALITLSKLNEPKVKEVKSKVSTEIVNEVPEPKKQAVQIKKASKSEKSSTLSK